MVEVIPLTEALLPGETFDIAVIFSMEDGWHTYWQNPGEAGMPTSFEWTLPENFKILSNQEPTPRRHVEEGITTFIHEEEAIYLFTIEAPDEIPDSNHFAVDIQWLECKDLCRPGSSLHNFSLAKGHDSTPEKEEWKSLVSRAEMHFPQMASELSGSLIKKGDYYKLALKNSSRTQILLGADFFPFDEMIYNSGKTNRIKSGFRRNWIIIPLHNEANNFPKILSGVLVQTHTSPSGPITTNSIVNQPLQ